MTRISEVRFPRSLPALLLLFVVSVCTHLWSQGIVTGSISGTVVDPQGAVVQKAQITATQIATNARLVAVSEEDGTFSLRNVPVGTYRISIEAAGFNPASVLGVGVDAGRGTSLGAITVKIGGSESVTVSGNVAPLLDTDDPQTTSTFDTRSVQNLPLSNGFDTITELIPGVVATHADNFSNTNGDNFSVNGQRGRSNNFELDGQSNNDNSIAGPQVFFGNQDAIQELQVITNNFGAQYGRNAGAVVNYITKNGTNAFHGSGFEFYTGSFLASLANQQKNPLLGFCASGESTSDGCLPITKPRNVENRFGGTLGGPIIKDKFWFFGSTFWDRLRNGAAPSSSSPNLTPTPLGLQQLAAAFPNSPGVAIVTQYGPFGVKAGNPTVIASSIQPVKVNGVPIEFGAVQRSIPNIFNDQEHLGRLDWQATPRDRVFARYFYQDSLFTAGAGSIAGGGWVDIPGTTHSIGADWTHTFSPTLIDQLRYSFQQAKVFFQGGAYPKCTAIEILNCPSYIGFIGGELDEPIGENPNFPQGRTVKVTQIQNNATWTHGAHTVVFGGEVDYQNSPNIFLPLYNAELAYNDFSGFVSDSGLGVLADGNPVLPFAEVDAAGYLQDSWKVMPQLTVNVGLRWEYFGQAFNKLHDETVKRESDPATAFWDATLPLSARTVPSVNEFYKNFQPRVGFAWNPTFLARHLVVRGGYAINSNPAFYNIFELTGIASPVANTGVFACGGTCQPASGSFSAADVRATMLPQLPRGGDPRFRDQTEPPQDFRNPYVQTYTLGFQYEIGNAAVFSATYVGSHTAKEFQSVNQNPFLLPVAQAFPGKVAPSSLCQDENAAGFGRPNCTFGNLGYTSNGAWAIYNGIQANLTTRNYHGLTSTISYTFSRSVDNTSEVFSTGAGGNSNAFSENPLDPNNRERGVSANSYPNALALAFNYDVPFFKNHSGMTGKLLGGFALNSIYRYTDGQPYTATQPLTLQAGDTSYCDGAFNSSGVGAQIDSCRLILSNKRAPLNTVAYLVRGPGLPNLGYCDYNSLGTDDAGNTTCTPVDPASSHWIVNNQAEANVLGNPYPGSGRDILRGDSYNVLDASIFKTTAIREGVSLQLQLNAYNVLNRQYHGAPLVGIENYKSRAAFNPFLSTDFNNSSSDYQGNGTSGNRVLQLGGKITF